MMLWIDDIRPAPGNKWSVAKTSQEAIDFLDMWKTMGSDSRFFAASFDHDLGGDDTSRRVMTWMIENEVWPHEVRIHTANPVGYQWLLGTARRYAPEWVQVAGGSTTQSLLVARGRSLAAGQRVSFRGSLTICGRVISNDGYHVIVVPDSGVNAGIGIAWSVLDAGRDVLPTEVD